MSYIDKARITLKEKDKSKYSIFLKVKRGEGVDILFYPRTAPPERLDLIKRFFLNRDYMLLNDHNLLRYCTPKPISRLSMVMSELEAILKIFKSKGD